VEYLMPGAEMEGVGPAAACWDGERLREIGNQGVAGRPADPPVPDQPVVGDAQHLPHGNHVGERRVGGLVMRGQVHDQPECAATVTCGRWQDRHQHAAPGWRDSGGLVADVNALHRAGARVDPHDAAAEAVRDPHRTVGVGDTRWLAAKPDGSNFAGPRVDSRHDAAGVGDPDAARARRRAAVR
jgi:hypothetical protein